MRKFFQRLLTRPIIWLGNRYTSRPVRERVFSALTELASQIVSGNKDKGLLVPFDITTGRFVIFSDQHKGKRDGADDFAICEPSYLAALDYYFDGGYHFISLGDSEELWENNWSSIYKAHKPTFEKEAKFIHKNAFIKVFGNHDLYWDNDPFAALSLKEAYGVEVPIHEGVILKTRIGEDDISILCTHGHQGDLVSDGNWLSKFFVSKIWAPLQSFLRINPNTPAYSRQLKSLHNQLMYEWSAAQKNIFLITGHTHQPLFESLTQIERLYRSLQFARSKKDEIEISKIEKAIAALNFKFEDISSDYMHLKPTYFNTGCCCFSDGDITGIEIEQNCFRLVKWNSRTGKGIRTILEETPIDELISSTRWCEHALERN